MNLLNRIKKAFIKNILQQIIKLGENCLIVTVLGLVDFSVGIMTIVKEQQRVADFWEDLLVLDIQDPKNCYYEKYIENFIGFSSLQHHWRYIMV
ncbi:hypothetical protein EIH08_02505 [Chryseobacterium taklimakanense]|uniref:Uncharacterized protein n=1 Tax=Chryseobacterium taklimakanense TaxID=536441 RepID=A0A3G8WJY9_9FLAO|nr:hypothetical protein [Chryseobacterium taklimakanense]AZI19747.1 hypothetical protein EIH08_02505 [Chryseobacterium taklimakanense]